MRIFRRAYKYYSRVDATIGDFLTYMTQPLHNQFLAIIIINVNPILSVLAIADL